jgi:hypothetical protein
MNIDDFAYKDFLPYYLTAEQKSGLAAAMKDFSQRSQLYTSKYPADTLQGDYWEKVPFRDFSGRRENIKVVILSNSCDIDPTNSRDFPVHMTYAPVIGLALFERSLSGRGMDRKKVDEKLDAIRNQRITNMIYLPSSGEVDEESVVLLDRATSIPYKAFVEETDKRKVTSLNQLGHYLLSFKLSIHFCRIHEGLARG